MERLLLGACHAFGVVVVLYTMWMLLSSVLLLTLVVVGVVMSCRFVAQHLDSCLPVDGRVVLITGCDTGIGHESAVAAAQRGLTVVAGCLNKDSEGASRLAAIKRVHVLQLDITSDDSIQAALEEVTKLCDDKGLWAVVNNAGFNRQGPVELMSMDTFRLTSCCSALCASPRPSCLSYVKLKGVW
ncbi:estradiol 17-beta-dehydrogenase 2-like [Littorina saxatilis]|uniref:Uncharacterized protein n=1 Tax=Littorina saxatilis TaxID=31220 RepID=A0AAN9AZM6_9CAEN